MSSKRKITLTASLCFAASLANLAGDNVVILDVPDYSWYAGCFGTASGNLMGYWDRNGFPNFYTGPTAGGVAPLDSNGSNSGIRSLWASKAGFDGRPADKPGHTDDYWEFFQDENFYSYESVATDPYRLAGRAEHEPDCIGDFIGASQNKWTNLDGECNGNIDAFSFNYWDKQGAKRVNFTPPIQSRAEVREIQSGWRKWAQSRGYDADVFSQLVDFNPNVPAGAGFTFQDLKAEIDAGYPVMLFLQNPDQMSRSVKGVDGMNPLVHGMVAYGYSMLEGGVNIVRYRTSWADGDRRAALWTSNPWEAGLALRGVIGFRPHPKITAITQAPDALNVKWDGPSSRLFDNNTGQTRALHYYVVERATTLEPNSFAPITQPSETRETVIPNCCEGQAFYRVKLVPAPTSP